MDVSILKLDRIVSSNIITDLDFDILVLIKSCGLQISPERVIILRPFWFGNSTLILLFILMLSIPLKHSIVGLD